MSGSELRATPVKLSDFAQPIGKYARFVDEVLALEVGDGIKFEKCGVKETACIIIGLRKQLQTRKLGKILKVIERGGQCALFRIAQSEAK